MTEKQVKKVLKKAGMRWKDFGIFMCGQTMGVYSNGQTNFYACDVEKFIRYKGRVPSVLWD